MEGDRYGQESMIVRRSISAGTLSLTPSVPDSVPPPEINLLFPEVFTVGSNPAGPLERFASFHVMTQRGFLINTTRDLRPATMPFVHLLRWILRCFCFAHNSGKIVIDDLHVVLVSNRDRMTDLGGFNIVRKFSSEFRGT